MICTIINKHTYLTDLCWALGNEENRIGEIHDEEAPDDDHDGEEGGLDFGIVHGSHGLGRSEQGVEDDGQRKKVGRYRTANHFWRETNRENDSCF